MTNHDGLTHLVKTEKAAVAVCGKKRDMWTSATEEAVYTTCEKCVESKRPKSGGPGVKLVRA